MIKHLVVVGVGLIGGSFALDLKRQGQVARVTGIGRSRANLETALERGIIDTIGDDLASAVASADLVMLAAPVGAMPALFAELAAVLPPDCIVTDAGSTKLDVIAAARAGLGARIGQFVPGHPIAGAETNGSAAARLGLYADKPYILTPLPENTPADMAIVESLWRGCGADVVRMDAALHDRVFAAVSHLPHLLAFALMDELASRPQAELYFRYAGAGLRDGTRIAGSHPEMWRDITLANRDALLEELDALTEKLKSMRALVAAKDGAALEQVFSRARQARNNWLQGKYND
ncbi:MAG: prephenate dehydrogenase [Hydrogenophilales bacterium 28-61-23]|nr:MAG: prephenate dehydrogenase [Hydrogenophilales bacterium 28-61-23]